MDSEKLKKKQSLKVIISEAIMVLAVIVMVAALALIVSGYWLNSDFKVERNGMLQISSIPTGADVTIDGETSSWLQRTNTSKVLSSGEHNIILTKDGYDSWSKTINISEGLLYRIHYPRLFLQDRESATVFDAAGATFATVSPNSERLLLINETTEWQLLALNNESLTAKKLNIADYFSDTSLADGAQVGLFTGKILDVNWDRGNTHALFKVQTKNGIEWTLLDIDNLKNSVNLTEEFGADFSEIEILDNSSSNLLAVQNGNLRKIDVPGRAISSVLADNVVNFDHYDNEVIFAAHNASDQYIIGLFKIGDNKTTELEFTTQPVKVAISKFYDDMYITTLQGSSLALYRKPDFTLVSSYELSFIPESIEVGHNGEFIVMHSGNQIAILDMESNVVHEWEAEGSAFDWLDDDMIYTVSGGELIVYDFDGFNRRVIAKNVSSHFPVTITDNKWLYYFSDGALIRELIAR